MRYKVRKGLEKNKNKTKEAIELVCRLFIFGVSAVQVVYQGRLPAPRHGGINARHLAPVLLSGHPSVLVTAAAGVESRTSGTPAWHYTLANTPPADVACICHWAVDALWFAAHAWRSLGLTGGCQPNVWPYGLEPALLPGTRLLPSPTCWLADSFQWIAEFAQVEIPSWSSPASLSHFYFIAPA